MARTLDDLAKLSGVSRATVSRVINGRSVSPESRQKVLEVVEMTGYRPNLAARNLASGRSGVVGVVMHVAAPRVFSDAYFAALLTGISDSLSEQAAGMMLWLGNRTKQETLEQILDIGMLDGYIVTADSHDDPLVDGIRASGLPAVLVGHRSTDRDVSYVDIDNESAAEVITDHLIRTGATRIGHITGRPDSVSGRWRRIGFEKTIRRAGLPLEGMVVEGNYTEDDGFHGAQALLDRGIDALFAANDYTARGAMTAIRERGLRVPEDVAVAGFDDLDFATSLDPALTTMRQRIGDIGHEAARTLLRILDKPNGGPGRVLLPTELVIRQSTARRPQG